MGRIVGRLDFRKEQRKRRTEEEELEKKAAVDEIKETVREREKQDAKAYREQIDDYGDEVVEKNVEPPHAPPRKCPPGLKPCDHQEYFIYTKGGPYKKMIPEVPKEQKEAEAKLKKYLEKKDAKKKVFSSLQGDKSRDVNIRKMDQTPDLKNMPININQSIRVGGLVEKDSVGFNRENMKHTFIITDNENTVKVEFKGILPNLFAEEKGVVVEGKQKNINTISAQQVLAKHDENYMPPEVIKILQDDGRWQGE